MLELNQEPNISDVDNSTKKLSGEDNKTVEKMQGKSDANSH